MRKLAALTLLASLLFLGAGCFGSNPVAVRPLTLEYWRRDEAPENLSAAIDAYRKIHPNVTINIRSIRGDVYEKQLVEAFAENRGPDLFSIPNVKLREYRGKITPLPKETVIPTVAVDAKGRQVAVAQRSTTLTVRELTTNFVEQVPKDVILTSIDATGVQTQAIYGLPYSLDTLAMFVNNDLLKKGSVDKAATTWADFQNQAGKLTVLDSQQRILQSGAAIGTARNIPNATELLSAIMMQNGAQMADENGFAQFDRFTQESTGGTYPPGVEAYLFYTSFAAQGTRSYSWNTGMPTALDAFIGGKTAMYFGYPRDAVTIRERAPRLDFTVNALPQVDLSKPANIAYYPIEVVSAQTQSPNEAWDFIQFASRREQVQSYLAASHRPTALRSLITDQLTNADVAPFAGQILTARSWYKGLHYDKAIEAFATMIETPVDPERPAYTQIVGNAVNSVNATFR
jgi:ABC-type glycerol-3-phosphate transport system substrate-binding protein